MHFSYGVFLTNVWVINQGHFRITPFQPFRLIMCARCSSYCIIPADYGFLLTMQWSHICSLNAEHIMHQEKGTTHIRNVFNEKLRTGRLVGVKNACSGCFRDGRQWRTSSCLFWSWQLSRGPGWMITFTQNLNKNPTQRCHAGLKA